VTCARCNDAKVLRSGAHCPECTHVISWPANPHSGNRARIATMHRVVCSCGWRHLETSRQNALGRASKMRGAVAKHLRDVGAE
jgi:hypothetical protein